MNANQAPGREFPGHPPVGQNYIPGIQDRFPENSKKNEKAASSICAGKEIYLTNEGIGAILPIDPNNLGRYSTINPFEVSMVIIDPGTQ
jgi:hypothetical protein